MRYIIQELSHPLFASIGFSDCDLLMFIHQSGFDLILLQSFFFSNISELQDGADAFAQLAYGRAGPHDRKGTAVFPEEGIGMVGHAREGCH